jgi:hypothetical protein
MDTKEALLYCYWNKIKGSYVECGVMAGMHPIIACNTILKNNLDITDIYMFDTYEGLTRPGKYDYSTDNPVYHMNNQQVIDFWKQSQTGDNSSTWCCCNLEEVKKNVYKTNYPKDKLHFIKGDVMETLKEEQNIPDKISVLRLDTDWYESSKFELEKLYHNVVDGGIVILDDYFHWDGQRRATDEFFQENNIKKEIYKNNRQTGYFIK